MSGFMTEVKSFFTTFLSMAGDVVTFITDNPMLLVAVIIAVAGIVIGIVKKFIPGL